MAMKLKALILLSTALQMSVVVFADEPVKRVGRSDEQSGGKKPAEAKAATTIYDPSDDQVLEPAEDDSVQLKIEPLVYGSLIDRVAEPVRLSVECAGAIDADFYAVPVDSPYGGKPVGKARSLGKDNSPGNRLSVMWTTPEKYKYFKVFVVVHKRSNPGKALRSRALDVAMTGARYQPVKDAP